METFKKYFLFINTQSKALIEYRNSLQIINHKNLSKVGLQSLWDIMLQAQDDKVQADATTLLVHCHMHFQTNMYAGKDEERAEVWKNFILDCVSHLRYDDPRAINAAVKLIIKFFNLFEDKDIDHEEEAFSNTPMCTV